MLKVYYGIDNKYVDISKFIKNNLILPIDNKLCDKLFGDPFFGKIKHILIKKSEKLEIYYGISNKYVDIAKFVKNNLILSIDNKICDKLFEYKSDNLIKKLVILNNTEYSVENVEDTFYDLSHIIINNIEYNVETYEDFCWKSYIYLNKELINNNILNKDSAYNHYKYCGVKEKRCYYVINKENFNWRAYLFYNKDLHDLGIDTYEKAFTFWNLIGFKISLKYTNNIFIKNSDILYNYYDSTKQFINIYKVNNDNIYLDSKIGFRYFCFKFLNYIRSIQIHDIEINKNFEAVLIEYRCFPHIEFIIRNNILKLGKDWSFTIICGNLNYDFIIELASNISKNIKVIKTDYDNLAQSTYSKLLASEYFWNLLCGEKILIYQEDSIIFKSNIEDFLEFDYIGAPWLKTQNDNIKCVGNGGFSLRTKKCMLEVIKKISILDTVNNESTINYMKNTKQTITPEDVYFTLNMLKYNIGNVADSKTASFFSTEQIYNENSLGGHNFWLSNSSWKNNLFKNILYCTVKDFNICAISTPYGLKMGGGESYLLNIAKYFINYKNCIIYFFVKEDENIFKETICRILNPNYLNYFILFDYNLINNFKGSVTYHIDMSNSKYPQISGCAINIKNNFYHCQFPFDTNKKTNFSNINLYNNIIVNSEFTKEKYLYFASDTKKYNHNIHVLYPNCLNINLFNNMQLNKQENSFVMIGRIFDYNSYANNKNFDIALKYFENLSLNNINNFHIYIIGEIFSNKMLEKLKSFKIKNIYFCNNISNKEKYDILSKCEYVINMVGINRHIIKECYAYEHFGISIIEAIYFKCIPISINGGYPPYYIKPNKGYLFNNEIEFYNIIQNIIVNKSVIEYDSEYYDNILKHFDQKSFNKNMNKLFSNQNT
jgi:hypothetical protein